MAVYFGKTRLIDNLVLEIDLDRGMDMLTLPVENWEQYRDLRLRALKEDPEAFSSSYADSVSQPDEFWKTETCRRRGRGPVLASVREAGQQAGWHDRRVH